LEHGILPVYVFDGKPPVLKADEIKLRQESRKFAEKLWQQALAEGKLEEARKHAQGALKLTTPMVVDSKRLLTSMGLPVIQAPSEGEAQGAFMTKNGSVWAVGGQDYDSVLYGAPRLVRNLTTRLRRKIPRQQKWITISPEIVETTNVLKVLDVSVEQMIDIGILVGTDYNDGMRGVGPKTALKLIRRYGSIEKVIKATGKKFSAPYEQIREIFLNPEVTSNYDIKREKPKAVDITEFLCNERHFSLTRVEKGINRLSDTLKPLDQTRLEDWF